MDLKKKIKLKSITIEDFVNYKKPSIFLAFPYCDFKCGRENCQNYLRFFDPTLEFSVGQIIDWYNTNEITKAYVFGGFEPFDSWLDLLTLISSIRELDLQSDIVIYTGYNESELTEKIHILMQYPHIIIKFGRYIPNQESVYDELLGVELASSNQYARRIEDLAQDKIIINPDSQKVAEIRKAIRENDGYCPCKLVKNEDSKCMCYEFRTSGELGPCNCGLFIRTKI